MIACPFTWRYNAQDVMCHSKNRSAFLTLACATKRHNTLKIRGEWICDVRIIWVNALNISIMSNAQQWTHLLGCCCLPPASAKGVCTLFSPPTSALSSPTIIILYHQPSSSPSTPPSSPTCALSSPTIIILYHQPSSSPSPPPSSSPTIYLGHASSALAESEWGKAPWTQWLMLQASILLNYSWLPKKHFCNALAPTSSAGIAGT